MAGATCKKVFYGETAQLKPNIPDEVIVNEKVAAQILKSVLPEYQSAIKFLIEQLRLARISFFDFRKSLENSLQHFIAENQLVVKQKKFVSYSFFRDKNRKSNVWTFELLMLIILGANLL